MKKTPQLSTKKTFWGAVPTTEEFHPGAYELPPKTKTRPTTKTDHVKLMKEELEEASKKINELEREIDENDFSSAEIELRLRTIIDHQENGINIRQMHLNTALDEKVELEHRNTALIKRVEDVRSKALNRKFQSRFWMMMFILSMLEHAHTGVIMWIATNIVMPVTTDVLLSNNGVAVAIRSLAFIAAIGYYRVDKMLMKIPSLV
tara:strand:- start:888 stop:1502 length:615 start_codon:yes stop_codon:yes gene_type:complete